MTGRECVCVCVCAMQATRTPIRVGRCGPTGGIDPLPGLRNIQMNGSSLFFFRGPAHQPTPLGQLAGKMMVPIGGTRERGGHDDVSISLLQGDGKKKRIRIHIIPWARMRLQGSLCCLSKATSVDPSHTHAHRLTLRGRKPCWGLWCSRGAGAGRGFRSVGLYTRWDIPPRRPRGHSKKRRDPSCGLCQGSSGNARHLCLPQQRRPQARLHSVFPSGSIERPN